MEISSSAFIPHTPIGSLPDIAWPPLLTCRLSCPVQKLVSLKTLHLVDLVHVKSAEAQSSFVVEVGKKGTSLDIVLVSSQWF
ncbi:hypothetical protein TNCV_4013391 [Trichonephila clavipes]|nr:hypothetical protein TNCV_4013391 [Trichonephila clavipes]